MPQIVQANVFDARLAPHRVPKRKPVVLRTGRCPDRRKHPRAVFLSRLAFDDRPCLRIEEDPSRAGLAIDQIETVAVDFLPAQSHDLVLAATGQQEKAKDVGLLALRHGALRMVVERAVKLSNLLARQEPDALRGGIAPDVPGRVGRDVPADKRMVEDLAKEVQHLVGAAGCRLAVGVEPPDHHDPADSVEAQRAEGGKQLALQCAAGRLLCGRFPAVVAGRLPRTGDEVAQQGRVVSSGGRCLDGGRREARPAHILDCAQRRRSE